MTTETQSIFSRFQKVTGEIEATKTELEALIATAKSLAGDMPVFKGNAEKVQKMAKKMKVLRQLQNALSEFDL